MPTRKPAPRNKKTGGRATGNRAAPAKRPRVDLGRPDAVAPEVEKKVEKKAGPSASSKRAELIAKSALNKKAEDVVVLDVRGLTGYAEFVVIMSGASGRQVSAVAEAIEKDLKQAGHVAIGVEGHGVGHWVLIDYGDVVAHVFETEMRTFYDLEGLWADAPRERVTA